MSDFITLSCPSCGAKLEITQDVNRFACSNCGREHIVKRSGGIVSLSPIVDAINEVRSGVDKTAAELAIERLYKEIPVLNEKRRLLAKSRPPMKYSDSVFGLVFMIVIGILFISISISGDLLNGSNAPFGVIFCLIPSLAMIFFGLKPIWDHNFRRTEDENKYLKRLKKWNETTGLQLQLLDNQIATKKAELQHYKDVVSL